METITFTKQLELVYVWTEEKAFIHTEKRNKIHVLLHIKINWTLVINKWRNKIESMRTKNYLLALFDINVYYA